MNKINIFQEDCSLGDRVIIYRNFGNADIEGVVSEIGESYIVLLTDAGKRSRLFEDIISGWSIIAPNSNENENSSISNPDEWNLRNDSESVNNEDEMSQIVTAVSNNKQVEPQNDNLEAPESSDSKPVMGVTIIGKIDLSKCGDPRYRKNQEAEDTFVHDALRDTEFIPDKTEVVPDETETLDMDIDKVQDDNNSDGESDNEQRSSSDSIRSYILNQFDPINSTFILDEDSLISSLQNLFLDFVNDEELIKGNAEIIEVTKSFCKLEKKDGSILKCYYSRVADYELFKNMKQFKYGNRIPVLACTYVQRSTGKEIVTAICGIHYPKDYIELIIAFAEEKNYVFSKLLFEIVRYCGILQRMSSSRANRGSWQTIQKELRNINFSQLDLPIIRMDLTQSSESSEKSIFRGVEQKIKRAIESGNIDSAVNIIDSIIDEGTLSSKYISSLLLRKAQIYSSADDTENAQQAYLDLISYNESIGAPKNNLSHLYTELARLLLLLPEKQSQAIEKLDKAIKLNPTNKIAVALKNQASLQTSIDTEKYDEIAQAEVSSNALVLSKMIDIDIQEHRFTDREVLEKNNIPTTGIALRLYEEANQSIEPEFYPKYMEAAKAFSLLKVGSYNLQNYLYVIANYSRLKGNYLCNSVKRLALNKNIDPIHISQIRRLKDSAQSYYLETLDLWSSISEDSFDIDNEPSTTETSKDEILGVVLEVLANYLKLDVAYYYLSNNVVSDYNTIFSSHFSEIFKQCIKSKNAELEKIAYRAVLQIGSYSIQVWTKLSTMGNGTKDLYAKFDSVDSKLRIYGIINEFLDEPISTSLQPSRFLQKAFDFHTQSRNNFEAKSASLQSDVLGPHNIAEITAKWEAMAIYWPLLSKTETETKDEITNILSVLKPYLSRKDSERTNLLIKAQGIIDNQIQFINDNTTYYGRTFFFPLLTKWRKELKNILDERIALTYPVLDVKGDPMYILNEGGRKVLNLVIANTGESSADGYELSLLLTADDKEESIEISQRNQEISAGDRVAVKIDITDYNVTEERVISIKAIISPYYLSNLLPAIEYNFSVESEKEEFTLTEEEILWSDTRTPEYHMFVGRKEILDRLVRHYSSIEKNEPYILYGLTRTGKSSILEYLKENINGKQFHSRDGKDYHIIPISIDFSTGASLGKSSDFWNYVINECVFPQLDELSIPYELFQCNGDNPRAKDFGLLLTDLKGICLYPLFLIDEFSYIRTLIDKNTVNSAFLHTLRQYSLDEKASFIYAGTYDVKSLIKDAKYGFTGALVTAHDEEVGKIDETSAEELMDAMKDKIVFTEDAKHRIHELSGDTPYFIQIICKNLGFYAVENKRKYIGYPELEKIVNILTGKETQNKFSMVRELPENRFQNNQYSPLDPPEVTVLISSIVHKNRGLKIPRGVSYAELQDMWGSHGISDFRPKLANAIGLLVEKKVLQEYQDDGLQVYKLSVDLFRLWWENHHKDISRELSSIM